MAFLHRFFSVALILAAVTFALAGSGRAQTVDQIRALDKTLLDYRDCVLAATERYANRTTEPAATVVEAAIGACGNERHEYVKASMAFGVGVEGSIRNAQMATDRLRPMATKRVLDVRSR
jgi:hypothetical protein